MISFAGDLADPAEAAFVEFLSQPHDDHKAANLGELVYSNGSVRPYCFPDNFNLPDVKQVTFGLSLFYDGPEPPAGLYDKLLDLPSTTKTVYQGNFTGFVSSQFLPSYNR